MNIKAYYRVVAYKLSLLFLFFYFRGVNTGVIILLINYLLYI